MEVAHTEGSEKSKKVEFDSRLDYEVVDFGSLSAVEKKEKMDSLRVGRNFVVLDIGPGGERTNLSVSQRKGDLWIGVDRAINANNIDFRKGSVRVDEDSKRVLVPSYTDELPDVKADLIMMVAPNPQSIVEEGLLGDIERFCKKGTQLFILLDNRTRESQFYGKKALRVLAEFLENNNFDPDDLAIGDRKIDTSTSRDAIGGRVVTASKFR
ncbi:TPA: hypothetical protein DCP77_03820 [Candidatus Collierbacteria bacterium]|uniref:Methyltransferase type 11 n=1 Tax=Candidatus Collierbacteria bacterium GW2011_GWA2_42_17 TaxID=1618378 RepID=A0A0G1B926_9BACT|nr:MAG: hypothetical protein UU94_C0004G0007 [Candidatus Collierbacteria bacterium GW2011_GWB2_42_12]KKS42821.1 MAG: hypothetical protein UV06_C0005G0015 [Candidatus Collierbacteria bacterium GW2011_GWA2_42_17]KKS61544.1 MAG: hypothetical protein UV29_C0039G0003 [Candidatus Collierbacteria bacterium GW2011_GWD2_42_50]KKS62121.1 MAG: hypothetical protein UV30_C0023G0005 [Candidatus Collierbacteria bacterium GW2011_GWF1_42_50]KKS62267.1 MAG: hypothetical protein UV28_C0013G0002 [Candidatus Collie